jgi:hypothetical protein
MVTKPTTASINRSITIAVKSPAFSRKNGINLRVENTDMPITRMASDIGESGIHLCHIATEAAKIMVTSDTISEMAQLLRSAYVPVERRWVSPSSSI